MRAQSITPPDAARFGTVAVLSILLSFPLLQILVGSHVIELGRADGGRGWIEFMTWLFVVQWGFFGLLTWDLRRRGMALTEIGFPSITRGDVLVVLGLLVIGTAFVAWVGDSVSPAVTGGPWELPRERGEKFVMLGMALTAGICEETIFRGYLYQGLRRMGRSMPAAITLITVSFVFIHGFRQPPLLLLVRAAAGLVFMALYLWRGSLRAPIFLHFLLDYQLALTV